MANWKSEVQKKKAVQCLKKLQQVSEISDSGSLTFGRGGAYVTGIGILARSIASSNKIHIDRHWKLVRDAIINAAKSKNLLSAETMLKEFELGQSKYLARKPQTYILATTISLNYFEELSTRNFDGAHITFSRYLPKLFTQNISNTLFDVENLKGPSSYTAVRVRVIERDKSSAMSKALDSLDALRGIWNLYLHYLMTRRSANPSPHNKIVLSRLQTLHHPGGRIASERYWYDPYRMKDPPTANIIHNHSDIKEYETTIRNHLKKSTCKKDLTSLLVRYVRALDESNYTVSFIKLWSVLEKITCTSNYDFTIKRASFLYKDPAYAKLELDHLRTCRNRSVHENVEDVVAEHLLNQLRLYVDTLLQFAILNAKHFSSLSEFGKFLDLPADKNRIKTKLDHARLAYDIYNK